MPKLVDEPRHYLCNPERFRSFSWNQHRPCHLESPFTDDQHKESPVLQIPSHREILNPLTHGAPVPKHLEHLISCAANSHHVPSRRTYTMICMVDVRCALGGRGQSVGLGQECSLPVHTRHRIPSPRPPCPRRPSRRSTQCHLVPFHTQHTVTFTLSFAAFIHLRSHGFSSLGLVFQAHSSCHQKVGLLQTNVTRLLCSLPSATWLIASTSTGLHLISAAAPDATFTNRSSTHTCPSFLSTAFLILLSLFMMYASSFPMNKSFLAWMMRDADTKRSSHVCNLPRALAYNPSGVLTDMAAHNS